MSKEGADTLDTAGYTNLALLVRRIDTLPQTDAIKSAGNKFESLARGNLLKIGDIDNQLTKDKMLSANITNLLTRDPAAFETALPQIFQNPNNASTLINQALAKAPPLPGATPVAASTAGADLKPAAPLPPKPTPIETSLAATNPAAHAAEPVLAPGAKNIVPEGVGDAPKPRTTKDKLEALQKFDGFSELHAMATSEDPNVRNQNIADLYSRLTTGGSPAENDGSLDTILGQAKENPKIFRNLVTTLKDPKQQGVVNTITSTLSGSPSLALGALSGYSELTQGPMGGFIGMIVGMLLGSKFGRDLIGMVSGAFADSKSLHQTVDNSSGALLGQASAQGLAATTVTTNQGDTVVPLNPAQLRKNQQGVTPNAEAQPLTQEASAKAEADAAIERARLASAQTLTPQS